MRHLCSLQHLWYAVCLRAELLKSQNGAEIIGSWCHGQPVELFRCARSDASGKIYRQEYNMNRKWLWLPGCRAFTLLLLCNSPTYACKNFYFIFLYLGFCANFRIVISRSLAAGGSLIICPQKSRLSCSPSLITASTSLDVITAFAAFLWATDWTDEEWKTWIMLEPSKVLGSYFRKFPSNQEKSVWRL